MAPLPDLIISGIKEILDKTENIEDKITRHNNIQNSLLELFKGLEKRINEIDLRKQSNKIKKNLR